MSNFICRILVIDDNVENRTALRDHLVAQGHSVEVVGDGYAAVDLMCANPYDLALLGINLPSLNGFGVVQQMKASAAMRDIGIIVISSVSDMDSVLRMIQLGADDYLHEPFTMPLLDLRISILMEKRELRQSQESHQRRSEKLAELMEKVILPVGIALSTEPNFDHLTERILMEAKSICNADAGTLYIRTHDDNLRFAIAITESLNVHVGGTSGRPIAFSPLPMYNRATGQPNHQNVATHVALTGKSINIPDIYTFEGFDFSATKIFDKQNNYRSVSSLTVPLKDNKGDVIGVLQLLNARSEDGTITPFDDYNRLVVESLSSQAAIVMNNHLLIQQQQKMAKIENDIEIARRIQNNFLPNQLPEVTGWEIGGRFQPAREVAGDFYDFFMMMNGRRLGIIIADVCDKGVGAALFMSLTRSLIRAFAMMNHNVNWAENLFDPDGGISSFGRSKSSRVAIQANALKTAVVDTNEYITTHHLDLNMFATLFFGMLDPTTGTLLYINGGHCPPMIISPTGEIKARLEPTGPAVGMFPGAEFEILDAHLDHGDILLGFTDGVTDARNPSGKLFHEAGLISLIAPPLDSAKGLLDRVDNALYNHIGDAIQFDDITMVAARREPKK
ncbi:MAG: SpoIIE family protein phosphatase [Anaerolinea sp.]|nr:SpoIIE family protein phosphatase [Anaerolinea sp.]